MGKRLKLRSWIIGRKTKRHIIDFFGAVMQNDLRIIALKMIEFRLQIPMKPRKNF